MQNQPLVSIIVISYNHSRFIKENLDSIKAQTYSNIELIVGDDASQDNSVEVFEEWLKDNHYTAAFKNYHQVNTGLATMLNECIEKANGKYLKLIAADDFLHPESIEKCVAKLEDEGEECGMVFTDTYSVDDNGDPLPALAHYDTVGALSSEDFKKLLLQGNQIAALTVVIRKKVLLETGVYDNKFIVEDYYRWLKISQKYTISYVPEKLAYYRQHGGNISVLRAERIEEEVALLQMMFDAQGSAKNQINHYLLQLYLMQLPIKKELRQAYDRYPYATRRLQLALRYHISPVVYKAFCRYI